MNCDNHVHQKQSIMCQEGIPSDLLGLPQWVLWRWEVRDGEKPTKVPYMPHQPHTKAKSTDPSTWNNFQLAVAVFKEQKCDGLGFVFTKDDPYTGFDLDNCRNKETGKLDTWAHDIVQDLQSYTEVSPSGTGVHILVRATLPPGSRRKGRVEMYDSGRFFCMTGQHFEGSPLTIETRQQEVDRLHHQTFASNQESNKTTRGLPDKQVTGLTDEEVLQKAQQAKNGQHFQSLWQGQWQEAYVSQSEADLALCGILAFWTGPDAEQLNRLFTQSALYRAKWDRHYSDGTTYGQRVIQKVLKTLQQTYQSQGPGQQRENPGQSTPSDLADEFLRSRGLQTSDDLRLLWYREEWWKFDGKIFRRTPMHDFRAEVMRFLQSGQRRGNATTKSLSNVIANLEALCMVPYEVAFPAQCVEGEWMSCPDIVMFENGILDIGKIVEDNKVPQVLPHSPRFASTVALPYAFDPKAQCPQWRAFLKEVLPDSDCQQLLRELFGYCLTYDTSLQKFFLFEGTGGNGKGVVLNILEHMLGKANVSSVPLELFGASHGLETTLGKLVNITAEIGNMDRVAEGLLKQFTGNDSMHFNPKYRQPFSAKPTAKLIMATNVRPPFKDRSNGLWRRLIMIPFPVSISENKENSKLTEDLLVELPGILNWAIGGAHSLRTRGRFDEPDVCVSVREEFKQEANPAREYLEENYTENPTGEVRIGGMYKDYLKHCQDNGVYPLSQNNFGREVRACFPSVDRVRVSTRVDKSRSWAYKGVDLLDDAPCPVS